MSRGEFDAYLRCWERAHAPVPASAIVRRWLSLCFPLAWRMRAVPPSTVTVACLLLAAAVPGLCVLGGPGPIVAAVIVVAAGIGDNIDGAVAAISGRSSRFGAVLDSVTDRCADTAFFLALWVLGAPGLLVGLLAGSSALAEYVRARSAGLGIGVATVTVWERPSRVITVVFLLLGAGVLPAYAALVATAGAAAGLLAAMAALRRLIVAASRGADHLGDEPRGQCDQRKPAAGMSRAADVEQAG